MKVKIFSTSFLPVQEKYEKFDTFEYELNEFISTVKVIDIKYSTTSSLCHDAQTHVNDYREEFSALVMYEEKPKTSRKKKAAEEDTPEEK
ncbi:MAG: hypothetical protein IJ666_06795 [Ruminococcus sp.]|nr:hypothetical protein [Ruminococcus sp.]